MRMEHAVDSPEMREQALQLDPPPLPPCRAGIECAKNMQGVDKEPLIEHVEPKVVPQTPKLTMTSFGRQVTKTNNYEFGQTGHQN